MNSWIWSNDSKVFVFSHSHSIIWNKTKTIYRTGNKTTKYIFCNYHNFSGFFTHWLHSLSFVQMFHIFHRNRQMSHAFGPKESCWKQLAKLAYSKNVSNSQFYMVKSTNMFLLFLFFTYNLILYAVCGHNTILCFPDVLAKDHAKFVQWICLENNTSVGLKVLHNDIMWLDIWLDVQNKVRKLISIWKFLLTSTATDRQIYPKHDATTTMLNQLIYSWPPRFAGSKEHNCMWKTKILTNKNATTAYSTAVTFT